MSLEPVGGGYTHSRRYRAALADGSRVFVKAAADAETATWLRAEHRLYTELRASFMPQLLGWHDDGELPVLVLEDLSDAHWPPPWHDVEPVRVALDALHALPALDDLPLLTEPFGGWRHVAEDPQPYLALGLCTRESLDAALPALLDAEARADVTGESMLHMDAWSGNICLRNDRALLVDWNYVHVGNPQVDLVGWLASMYAQGGPPPWELLQGATEMVVSLAGVWAANASGPEPAYAPGVNEIRVRFAASSLAWAAHELGLTLPS